MSSTSDTSSDENLNQLLAVVQTYRQAAKERRRAVMFRALLLVGCSVAMNVVVDCNNVTSFPVASGICMNATCRYELTVTEYQSMMVRDSHLLNRRVFLNGTELQVTIEDFTKTLTADEVITADGQSRKIILINGQFPGPTIEVLAGAQVCKSVNSIARVLAIPVRDHPKKACHHGRVLYILSNKRA